MKFKKEYIESEEYGLGELEKKLKNMSDKWFKTSGMNLEIDFLKNYIKLKKKLIKDLE